MKKIKIEEDPMVASAMDLFEDSDIVEIPQEEYKEEKMKEVPSEKPVENNSNNIGTEINAQIDNADIILTEHGFVSIYLTFKWNGYGQGINLYNLDGEYLSKWVHAILETLEIDSWKDVKGKYCRIIRSEAGVSGNIIGIKNIINDKAFMISDK